MTLKSTQNPLLRGQNSVNHSIKPTPKVVSLSVRETLETLIYTSEPDEAIPSELGLHPKSHAVSEPDAVVHDKSSCDEAGSLFRYW